MGHCEDNGKDRELGKHWERAFCRLAATYGRSFSPMQIEHNRAVSAYQYQQVGRRKWNIYTLPDVTVWTYPGEHHEIKHKSPTRDGMFGLEVYRFEALLWFANETHQDVMYTIHNHALSGGREVEQNDIAHWQTASVLELNEQWIKRRIGNSWVNGAKRRVPIYYWSTDLWGLLAAYWQPQEKYVLRRVAVSDRTQQLSFC